MLLIIYITLDKLSKFPYNDETPTGRDANVNMAISMVRKGFPSAAQSNQIIEKVREKDVNIVELIEGAKNRIVTTT